MMKDICQKVGHALHKLGGYSIEKKYDLTLALYPDADTDTPESSHHFSGGGRHNLCKMTCLVVMLSAAIAAICMLYGCCRKSGCQH